MKKTLLVSSISLAFSLLAVTAQADYADISIDSDIILNLDQEVDLTGAIQIPTVELEWDASNTIIQNNHATNITAVGTVNNNSSTGDINVDVTAVGNNVSVDLSDISEVGVIGVVQGNQETTVSAIGEINGNNIGVAEVELNTTAVGNNISISNVDTDVQPNLGSVQFNYDTTISAEATINDNNFGVPRDPTVNVTAVGNNISSFDGTLSSTNQLNVNSTVSSVGQVNGNLGNIGPITVAVTSVGNNLSISVPTE